MQDKRRRTDAQKAKTKRKRLDEADRRRRYKDWLASAVAADQAGYPINTFLTVIWGDPRKDKDAELWRRLRLAVTRSGVPWLAMRSPEYAPRKGHHLHIAFHIADEKRMALIDLVESITSTNAAWVEPVGRRLGSNYGVIAKSADTTWMLQRHLTDCGPIDPLIDYISKASGKTRVEGRHQRSQALIALSRISGAEKDAKKAA